MTSIDFAYNLRYVMIRVGGALWGLFTYLDHEREVARNAADQEKHDEATRTVEARQPFLKKQLDLYFEAAQTTGKLVTLAPDAEEWKELERRFWELYWSEL